MRPLLKYAPWVIALVALCSAVWGWYHPREVQGPTAWVDRTVTLTETKYVPMKLQTPDCTVQTVDMDRDKQPDTFQGNPVTAVGEAPETKTGYDIKTTITTSTGETQIYMKPKPQSLFGFENGKEIGLRGGTGGQVDLFGRWTFIRVGSLYGALYGQASNHLASLDKIEANALLEVSCRW